MLIHREASYCVCNSGKVNSAKFGCGQPVRWRCPSYYLLTFHVSRIRVGTANKVSVGRIIVRFLPKKCLAHAEQIFCSNGYFTLRLYRAHGYSIAIMSWQEWVRRPVYSTMHNEVFMGMLCKIYRTIVPRVCPTVAICCQVIFYNTYFYAYTCAVYSLLFYFRFLMLHGELNEIDRLQKSRHAPGAEEHISHGTSREATRLHVSRRSVRLCMNLRRRLFRHLFAVQGYFSVWVFRCKYLLFSLFMFFFVCTIQ